MTIKIKVGDIVKYQDAPCEVFVTYFCGREPCVYLINKKTLVGAFLFADQVEFVRRPGANPSSMEKRK